MKFTKLLCWLYVFCLFSCSNVKKQTIGYEDITVAGAMKNVMWQGELAGIIRLDTISNKKGLYGLGPLSFLKGELIINDGKVFVSKVISDSAMLVEENPAVAAPFFVYGNVTEWKESPLPTAVRDLESLETYINKQTQEQKRPFVFKLKGKVDSALIHIQNLPEGTKVSSPKEAHQGQIDYLLSDEMVEIIGFFSTEHKGIFTHHDSFLHMHLMTQDQTKMGHLDEVLFSEGKVKLYLPLK